MAWIEDNPHREPKSDTKAAHSPEQHVLCLTPCGRRGWPNLNIGLLRQILSSADGVRVQEAVNEDNPGLPADTSSDNQGEMETDDLPCVPVLVRASDDIWSRNARRNQKKQVHPNSRPCSPAPEQHDPRQSMT